MSPFRHGQHFSEFTSPTELDEAAKMHYQRIAAESTDFVYGTRPEVVKPQTMRPEVIKICVYIYDTTYLNYFRTCFTVGCCIYCL